MKNFLKSRTIQSALILAFVGLVTTVLIIFFKQSTNQQTHYGSGDNIIIRNERILIGNEYLPTDIREENLILIQLTYEPPRIVPEDQCDESCVGVYTKIGENSDFLYLDHPACKSSRVIGYNYDSGEGGKKIITHWQIEEKRTCDWIAVPKHLVLHIVKISDSTSTVKMIPNYKVIE